MYNTNDSQILLLVNNMNIFSIYIAVPSPMVATTALNDQIVGQSLTLQCEVTTVRGIDFMVDIIWRSRGEELQRMSIATPTTINDSLVYSDNYTITFLSTSDEGRIFQCQVVIDSIPVMASNNFTLDVNGEYTVKILRFCSYLSTFYSTHSSHSYSHHITIWSHTRSYGG